MKRVAILLSTYNGQAYLREQLDSLRQQSFSEWEILIRDDGSRDETRAVLREYAQRDRRFHFQDDDHDHLGPVQSFARLLEQARDYDVIFFCDQDDFWLPTKLHHCLDAFSQHDALYGAQIPFALHTDLEICDERLRPICASMKGADRSLWNSPYVFSRLLAQNYVTGCSLAINRSLAQLSLPIPPAALMHDWWIALLAAALGRIQYLSQVTVRYRQHGLNASGSALSLGWWAGLKKIFTEAPALQKLMHARFAQSRALEECLRPHAPNTALFILQDLHRHVNTGRWAGLRSAWRHGIRMRDSARTLAYYFLLWREGPALLSDT